MTGAIPHSEYDRLGSVLTGAAVSFALYGITCCQVIWYFRNYPRDTRGLKLMVVSVWFFETMHGVLVVNMLWYYLIRRGNGESPYQFYHCGHWTMIAQGIPAEICCVATESFLLRRVYQITDRKKLAACAAIPFLVAATLTIAYFVQRLRYPCSVQNTRSNAVFGTSAILTTILDLGLALATGVVLYGQRSGLHVRSTSLPMIRFLIVWTMTTGVLMAISTVAFMALFLVFPSDLFYLGVYLLHAKIYANTLLATLNSRSLLRSISEQVMELSVIPVTRSHGLKLPAPGDFS
ncbi:hypothetical protein B0H34DRAFT_177369 [Crassisporium funariophilum]|nr:hypothetical protein B0H34DRAFT_177369 [Crassisporium funariophilum]